MADRITGLVDGDSMGLDELVASNVNVHIERLDTGHFWIGVHYPDGTTWALWLHSKSAIRVTHERRIS